FETGWGALHDPRASSHGFTEQEKPAPPYSCDSLFPGPRSVKAILAILAILARIYREMGPLQSCSTGLFSQHILTLRRADADIPTVFLRARNRSDVGHCSGVCGGDTTAPRPGKAALPKTT